MKKELNELEKRLCNTQVYISCLTIGVLVFIFGFIFLPPTRTNLPDNTTIRGQEIATKCDLKNLGNSEDEEVLNKKLTALANHFKLEFEGKWEFDPQWGMSYKHYKMKKQGRK